MRGRGLLLTSVAALVLTTVAAAAVSAPRVKTALLKAGYDARTQCGVTLVAPPSLHSGGHAFSARRVPTCWVVVERDGYSVHVTPYASPKLAQLAYVRSRNPWAKTTREVAVGNVLLSAYRLSSDEWSRISTVVTSVIKAHR